MIRCFCDACHLEIMKPRSDQSIGYGITGDVRAVAPKEVTVNAGIQICADCCELIATTWGQRQKPEEVATA